MAWIYGRHRGRQVSEIPTDYLLWFIGYDGAGWASPKRKHRRIALEELCRRNATFEIINRSTELAMFDVMRRAE
jgi:hypothetical protein